jgi:hypothetical protein
MKSLRSSALAVILLLLLMQLGRSAFARDLFVNNQTGHDDLTGLSVEIKDQDGPVETICCALKLAAPGDRIEIANTGEPYREQVSIFGCNLRGYEDRPLTINGNGAVIDGTVLAADGAWRHVAGDVFAMRPRRLTYQQLFRDDSPLKRVRLASARGVDVTLQPLQWAFLDGDILLRVEQNNLPQAYDLRHAGQQTGITLYNTRHVVIEDLVVQGFQQDGINAHELVRDCVLRGVECRANGRSGLSVGGVSRVRVEASSFYDNGRAQVRVEGHSKVELIGCEVEGGNGSEKFELRGGRLTVDGKPTY